MILLISVAQSFRFGPGLVIYWCGFLSHLVWSTEHGILVRDSFPTEQEIVYLDPLRSGAIFDQVGSLPQFFSNYILQSKTCCNWSYNRVKRLKKHNLGLHQSAMYMARMKAFEVLSVSLKSPSIPLSQKSAKNKTRELLEGTIESNVLPK